MRFTEDVNIKEGKMAVPFRLHSELNVPMDTVQVVKELRQLAWTMGQNDEHVIHIAKPAEGLVTPFRAVSSKCSMKKLAMTGDSGKPMATPLVCSQNWLLNLKMEEVSTWQKSFKMSSSECQLRMYRASSMVNSETTSKLTRMSSGSIWATAFNSRHHHPLHQVQMPGPDDQVGN
jgi:hypothetical protein